MASAHIIRFFISSPLSFHEEVCGNEEIQFRHINQLELKLRTKESDRRENNLDTGRSPEPRAHTT